MQIKTKWTLQKEHLSLTKTMLLIGHQQEKFKKHNHKFQVGQTFSRLNNIQELLTEMMKFLENQSQQCHMVDV